MGLTACSIGYYIIYSIYVHNGKIVLAKDVQKAYQEKTGRDIKSTVMQGTLARLRKNGLVKAVSVRKVSTGDASGILAYKLTKKGKEELEKVARIIISESDDLKNIGFEEL